ncbi:MAG: ATP-binding protein [Phycisphaerales bacterium]|jgi:predicted kinase|nr:ATP-binding protein [Phycisphaerales bacterium]
MEAVILIGLQASGKSTFYRDRFCDSHVRINLDMLRTRHREKLLLQACLEMKQKFVIDNTNPEVCDRQRYIPAAREAGFKVVGYYFQSRLDDLLSRNNSRSEDRRVPDLAIRGAYSRLVLPSRNEGFDELYYVSLQSPAGFVVKEWDDEV